jgi:hypothetical protein
MAQKKLIAAKDIKQSITQAIQAEDRGRALADISKQNLAISDTNSWRTISAEHRELVLVRCYGGETVSQICRDLGFEPGHIYQLAYMDDEFAQRLSLAREIGQHALVDKLLEIPFDKEMSHDDKKLYHKAITWTAARVAKNSRTPLGNYNERTEVDERNQTVIINLPFGDKDTEF